MTYDQSYRRILQKMGYYDYQHGLIFRHLKQDNEWNRHLENCRNFILHAADIIKPEKITVLGSGWLLEFPLAELAERTENICLIDILHPKEVVEQVGQLKNVELVEEDVSGGLIREVWLKAGKRTFLNKLSFLENIRIPEFNLEDPGMVISLNILTQLESLPVKFLRKKAKVSESDLSNFRKKIQESHIRFLKKHKSVVITDTHEVFLKTTGSITDIKTLIADLPDGIHKKSWRWDFDIKGLDFNTKRSVFEITAIIL
jgi:hypothetical protein